MQGDSAPCGTTDRDVDGLHLLTHAGSAARSAFLVYFVYFVVSHPHMQCFFCVFCGFSHAGSAARSAFWCILCILWFPLHMQCFFRVVRVFRGLFPRWQCCA